MPRASPCSANSDRTQLRLDYEPDLEIHLINGSQNLLAQQFNGVGTVTLVPELFFVDVRAVAGVQASQGGIGGLGTLGQNGVGGITGASLGQGQTVDAGVAKNDRTQTASFSISPYMLFQFGDIGTGKIGTTLSESTASSISGFAPVPLVSGGTNDQHLSSFEQYAQFQSGDVLSVIRDTASADAMQSTSGGTGVTSSTRATVSNRVDYQINVSIDVYGQIGYEDISYSGNSALEIHDITWGVGTVLTPNPDSQLSLGYGHENGANTFTASGHYALTARTILTVSYNNGVGTQLEQVNQQLNQASVANNGSLVNSQSGTQLFVNNNALGVTQGIYRYNYLTFGATTILDRDTFGVTIGNSQQTQLGAKTQTSNGVTTGTLSWTHELSPDPCGDRNRGRQPGHPDGGKQFEILRGWALLAVYHHRYSVGVCALQLL